jgi:monoamine oxidase
MPPGVWTGFGDAIRTGRTHLLAGSEITERWDGFFEGALF